jgi:biotin operon repressor
VVSRFRQSEQFFQISSYKEVRELAMQILNRDRNYPVIALTPRRGEERPALSVARVRKIVGQGTPVYFIPSYDFMIRLNQLLPRFLSVSSGAARLWWPGVGERSQPEDHPKFYELGGASREFVYEWLESEFAPSPLPSPLITTTFSALPPPASHEERRLRRPACAPAVDSTKLLSHFDGSHTMSHGELAHRAGISRSAAHRYLTELVCLGYLIETRERRYRLVASAMPVPPESGA